MKNIIVVISAPPSACVSEQLRMAVGLTLDDDNRICVLLIDDGAFTALGLDAGKTPDGMVIDKSLQTLSALGVDLLVDSASAQTRITTDTPFPIKTIGEDEVSGLLEKADIVIA